MEPADLDQFEWLIATSRTLAQCTQEGDVYQRVVSSCAELAGDGKGGTWVSLWLYDPVAYSLRLQAAEPEADGWLTSNHLSLREEPVATVARARTILVVPTLPEILRRDLRPTGLPSGGVGAALLPLSVDIRLLGLLLLLGTPTQLARLQQRILSVKLFSIQAALAMWGVLQRELSMVDHLTRAYNYACFTERLTLELQRCHRFELPLSLLLIDVDGFKAINDTYGHEAGDRVLVTTVQIIRRAIRTMDVLARYGGDEFVIMLPELGRGGSPSACDALPVAKRICEAVAQHPFAIGDRQPLRVTVSIGIGIRDDYDPPSVNPAALFQQADEQLYRAKRAGKNQCAFPDQSPAGVHYHSIPR